MEARPAVREKGKNICRKSFALIDAKRMGIKKQEVKNFDGALLKIEEP